MKHPLTFNRLPTPRQIMLLAGALECFCYGVHIWLFHSFRTSSAFTLYGPAPEWSFSMILLLGTALIIIGLRLPRPALALVGCMCGFTVFFAAFCSCVASNLPSTGTPAYFGLSVLYLALAALCADEVPIPPATQ